jgi:hypothetical protein
MTFSNLSYALRLAWPVDTWISLQPSMVPVAGLRSSQRNHP